MNLVNNPNASKISSYTEYSKLAIAALNCNAFLNYQKITLFMRVEIMGAAMLDENYIVRCPI